VVTQALAWGLWNRGILSPARRGGGSSRRPRHSQDVVTQTDLPHPCRDGVLARDQPAATQPKEQTRGGIALFVGRCPSRHSGARSRRTP
jgi:hypothetical protein